MEENECPECPALPGWLATFADLMSLLMCFFVLLLSFSEMDAQKYKRVAGSMRHAFGVQRLVKVNDPPKGTSAVVKEFSPARPQPTIVNVVQQATTQVFKQNLDFTDTERQVDKTKSSGVGKGQNAEAEHLASETQPSTRPLISEGRIKARLQAIAENKAEEVRRLLREEIEGGSIEVEAVGEEAIIRVRERGFFATGRAELQAPTRAVLDKIAASLNQLSGALVISGHTDDVPISNAVFRSNWELSSARAANVVHYLSERGGVAPERMEIRAHADMVPLVANESAENRARNRRVEIAVQATTSEREAADLLKQIGPPPTPLSEPEDQSDAGVQP